MPIVALKAILLSFLALSSAYSIESNFFNLDYKDGTKKVSVTLITESPGINDFESNVATFFNKTINTKTPLYLSSIDPDENDPSAKILLDNFLTNLNGKYENLTVFQNKNDHKSKRYPAQEINKELNWDAFNKYYTSKNLTKRKALVLVRGFVNGSIVATQGFFFDKLPMDVALTMGTLMGLLSSGIMQYDYLLNRYLNKSLLKNYAPTFERLKTFESYARWFSVEFGFLIILKIAQWSLGATPFFGFSSLPVELSALALTGLKSLMSQGVYEFAILKWSKNNNYDELIANGKFLDASKIRSKIEFGKFLGSMMWAVAAIADLSGYKSMSNITFVTLAATGGLIYALQPSKTNKTTWINKLKNQWQKNGLMCNRYFVKNEKINP